MRINQAMVWALLACGTAAAAQERSGPPLWEVGGFVTGFSQQAYPGAEEDVSRALALPYAVYRGEWLRADRDSAGVRALKTDRVELDIGFGGSLGARSDRIAARFGMPRLGTFIEAGPRLQVKLGESQDGRWKLELPLRAVFDINDGWRHRGAAFEPALVFERRLPAGMAYSAKVGAVWGDRRLNDTFYGVAPVYANASRPAYEARPGLIAWRIGSTAVLPIGRDWRFIAFARWQSVAGSANEASPLVRREGGWSGGIGLSWTWLRSDQRASD